MRQSFNVCTVRLSSYNKHKALRMFSAVWKAHMSTWRPTSKTSECLIPKTFMPLFLPGAGWHSWTWPRTLCRPLLFPPRAHLWCSRGHALSWCICPARTEGKRTEPIHAKEYCLWWWCWWRRLPTDPRLAGPHLVPPVPTTGMEKAEINIPSETQWTHRFSAPAFV